MLPWISNGQDSYATSPERRTWAQRVLQNFCLFNGKYVASKTPALEELLSPRAILASESILTPFRAWEVSYRTSGEPGNTSVSYDGGLLTRRRVWRTYYDTLSVILRLCCRPSASRDSYNTRFAFSSSAARNAELKTVEVTYEKILLQEVGFPEANTANTEVETWTDQVMANWAVLSAPTLGNEDLEEGGKPALTRRVLEVISLLTPCVHVASKLILSLDTLSGGHPDLPLNKDSATSIYCAFDFG